MDEEDQPPKKVISLEEIQEKAERRKFSDDPEVEALRHLTLKELRTIAEDDEDPRQAAATKAITTAMKPFTSFTNDWVASVWGSTELAKSVRNSLVHSGLLPKFKFDIPNFYTRSMTTASADQFDDAAEAADDEEAEDEASEDDEPEMTAAEIAATPMEEILQGIRAEAERANERLYEVIDELAGMAKSSEDAAATARKDAADAREDATKSHRSAWIGIWVAVVVGILSIASTTIVAVLTSPC